MATDGPKQLNLDYTKYSFTRRLHLLKKLGKLVDKLPGFELGMFEIMTLRAINDEARGPVYATMTRREIAEYWGGGNKKSFATVSRAVSKLKEASLLICEENVDKTGQRASRYKIVWPNIEDIAEPSYGQAAQTSSEEEPEPVPDEVEEGEIESPPPSHTVTTPTQKITTPSLCEKGASLTEKTPFSENHHPLRTESPLTSYTLKNLNTSSSFSKQELKAEAVEILKFTGLDCLVSAVQLGIDNRATLEDFREIAEHYRSNPGKWDGPGAVYHKLREFFPGQEIWKGWPDPSPKWQAEQKRQLQAAKLAQERQQREQQTQTSSEAANELESRYGPMFDAMSDEEIGQLIDHSPGGEFQKGTWKSSGRESRSLRRWLLIQLAKQFQEAET